MAIVVEWICPLLWSLWLGCHPIPTGLQSPGYLGTPDTVRIATVHEPGLLRVFALYEGTTSDSLRYALNVVREGQNGRSESRQGGIFQPSTARIDTLSTVQVNVALGDRIRIDLKVVDRAESVVGEAHVERVFSAEH